MADPLALASPGSSDAILEGHPQPAKMAAALRFGHPQDLAALEHMDMNISFQAGRHQDRLALWYHRNDGPWTPQGLTSPQGDVRNQSILNTLRGNPLVFSHYRESIVPSDCDTVPPGAIPPPSDSGYGGSHGAKLSVANGSVCDESLDRNPETQSLVGHINELNFQSYSQDMVSRAGVIPGTPWPQSQPFAPPSLAASSTVDHTVNLEGIRECDVCKKLLKTRSEFKKHKQRHDKPFRCDVKDCTRREGFSTSNDLDRHKRSLHPDEKVGGNRYQCPVGMCKNKDKIWPRADNFRAHLKRVHQKDITTDEDLDQYRLRSAPPSKEPTDVAHSNTARELNQFGASPTENVNSDAWALHRSSAIDLPAGPSSIVPVEDPSQTQVEETPSLEDRPSDPHRLELLDSTISHEVHSDSDDALLDKEAGIPGPTSPHPDPLDDSEFTKPRHLEKSAGLHSQKPDSILAGDIGPLDLEKEKGVNEPRDCTSGAPFGNTPPNGQLVGPVNTGDKAPTSSEPGRLDTGNISPLPLDITNRDNILHLLETLQSRGVLEGCVEELGYRKDIPPDPEDAKQESIASNVSEQHHVCPRCPKTFSRRCELKKHEKRHLKPYGCTSPGCDKRFGSKNDWKRHENSQHFMLEHWRCDEKQADDPSRTCGKIVYRRELFKQHLGTWHHVKDQASLEIKLETCRVGRNSEARFWCGFCREIIENKEEGIHAWTERFDHIDDHFHGRNNQVKKEISDWKNEYLLNPRPESPANDSEDSSAASSEMPSSADGAHLRGLEEVEKQQARVAKPKRKRDDGYDATALKRIETMEEMPRYHCCQCRETMPVTSRQCTNYPCEHRLCEDCS
ncbi:hypothetical protein GGR54DRAFT_593377 [Hypoxylon sp. NC1633]|nr:hypothetical protein GGR54DRAFT_593377 [Hypoxylon sp. NC1633]